MIGVIGESLIDFIAKDGQVFDSHVGGCGLNAATAIGCLGGSVMFFGGISNDMFGKRILAHLVSNQVLFDPDLCNAPFPSMLGFASLDAKGCASYAFYAKGSAPMTMSTQQLSMALSVNTDIRIVHIGSVSLAMRPVCDSIIDSVDFLSPKPVVYFDPNVRLSIIDDMNCYTKRFLQVSKMADIIKLSDEDLQAVFEGLSDEEAVATLRKETSAHIILTRGAQGSTWYAPDGIVVTEPCLTVDLVDTVGAGDTFSGALLFFLQSQGLTGEDGTPPMLASLDAGIISQALHFASTAAGINCSRPGCQPPSFEELSALL